MLGISTQEIDIKKVVEIKTGTRPIVLPIYPQNIAAIGRMQKAEQKPEKISHRQQGLINLYGLVREQ